MANTFVVTLVLYSMVVAMVGAYASSRPITVMPQDPLPSEEHRFRNLNLAGELTTLHFYVHDFVSGPNQSVYTVAQASITPNSSSLFGTVQVLDHLVTSGPEVDSEKVGRVQGIHALADLEVAALGANWNFLFDDEYNSTITVVGRLVAFAVEGELSIVGGTGKYPMARGIAFKRTVETDPATHNSVMEYTLYVYSQSALALPAM
jgi:hypothetical protein